MGSRSIDDPSSESLSRHEGASRLGQLAEFSVQLANAVSLADVARAVSSLFDPDHHLMGANILVPTGAPRVLGPVSADADASEWTSDVPAEPGSPQWATYRSGRDLFVPSRAELIEHWPDIESTVDEAGIGAIATLCLDVTNDALGVLEVSWTDEHEFTDQERSFLATSARLVALTLCRLRHIEAQHAEALRDLARFQLVSALSSATSMAAVADSIIRYGPTALEADHCWVRLLGVRTPAMVTMASSHGAPRKVIDDLTDKDPTMPLRRAVELGRPVLLETLENGDADATPHVEGIRSAAAFPLMADDEVVGAIGVGYSTPQVFDGERTARFATLVNVCVAAVSRLRLVERDRRISHELQQAMLGDIDEVVGLDVYATYRAADDDLEAGGDFYDAIALPDGRVGLVVGDIVGHTLTGTAAMGQLRSAVRGAAMCLDDPAELTGLADRIARTIPGADMATLAYVVVDLSNERITYSTAGHLPPLLCHAEGTSEWLDGAAGAPLGLSIGTPQSTSVPFREGDTIVMYTDGLIERRDETLDDGMRRLHDNACRHRGDTAHVLASTLVALAFDGYGQTDDLALLIARHEPGGLPTAP
jgi:GAF domain-containing protein